MSTPWGACPPCGWMSGYILPHVSQNTFKLFLQLCTLKMSYNEGGKGDSSWCARLACTGRPRFKCLHSVCRHSVFQRCNSPIYLLSAVPLSPLWIVAKESWASYLEANINISKPFRLLFGEDSGEVFNARRGEQNTALAISNTCCLRRRAWKGHGYPE